MQLFVATGELPRAALYKWQMSRHTDPCNRSVQRAGAVRGRRCVSVCEGLDTSVGAFLEMVAVPPYFV